MDVAAWLRGLGLEQYAQLFRDNDIDGEILCGMAAEDLKELGISSFGHRRRLLNAITVLRGEPHTRDVAQSATSVTSAPASPPPIDAERRQLTVMFCDLAGSTALSARLDPEDLREVIAAYHHTVADVVRRFDGFVAKYMGDGVLVYFGYPRAHEEDAERAVRAGLALIDAVGQLDLLERLQARVGIATGLVVVGDLIGEGSAQEQAVVGETPNLAARLQALAGPNAVVIAAGTRRLLGDLFEYRNFGSVEVKGIAAPIPAYQVLRPSAVASRFEALRGSVLSPLFGRGEELRRLARRWERAKTGSGQVVLISGEPGLGKSRITIALAEHLLAERHTRLRYFCSPYHQDSALFPFTDQLGRAAGFAAEDPPAARLDKLEALLALAKPPDEDLALLADLLSLPGSDRRPLPELSPQRKKAKTLEALMRQLEGLARRQPVLIVFEDAHWIDPTSRELLDLAVERVGNLPALLVITFRPEFQQAWVGQPQVTMLALNRLAQDDRTALVDHIAGGKALPQEVIRQIVDRADGVPLFIEELTKSVLESGLLHEAADRYELDGALPPFAIPATLHDSLMARLDRLAAVRQVAQIGAAIGREFSYALLRMVSRLPEEELQAALERLTAAELVFPRGVPPDVVYRFKHALVQDAAYGSLLRSTRQQLHAQIAEALETGFPEVIEHQPELLAQHYAEAVLAEKSIAWWSKAGHRSAARSSLVEAAAQFHNGIDQLMLLPETPQRQRRELEFRVALGTALRVVKGFAAPETGRAFARGRELWEQLGYPSEFFHVAQGQATYHLLRGELDLALRLNEELLRASRERNDPVGQLLAHNSLAVTLMFSGRFASARSHLEEGLALHDPIARRLFVRWAARVGPTQFSYTAPRGNLAVVLFCVGYPDQALSEIKATIVEARRLAHPPSLVLSQVFSAILLSLVRDHAALDRQADELAAGAIEHGFPLYIAQGAIFRGWAKVKHGKLLEGMALLCSGSNAYRAAGSEVWMPQYRAFLARTSEIAGQIEEAAALLDDALHNVERTGERWFEAELNRHKGQLLLRQGYTEAAEELYRKALSIAMEQEAKLWELRAAVSLARLRRDQGRRGEGRDLLVPVYNWFTEGFGTPDLKDARALLDELA
jgi:class 3 adenylate cyclase/predicted ATPase